MEKRTFPETYGKGAGNSKVSHWKASHLKILPEQVSNCRCHRSNCRAVSNYKASFQLQMPATVNISNLQSKFLTAGVCLSQIGVVAL